MIYTPVYFFIGKKIGENISENEFVKILSRKVQGTLSFTSSERTTAFDTASPLQKVLSNVVNISL